MRSNRATALWLLVLVAVGTTVFSLYPPGGGSGGTTFNSLVYTLDLLIPIVDFGQERAFGIAGPAQWLAYVLTAIGSGASGLARARMASQKPAS